MDTQQASESHDSLKKLDDGQSQKKKKGGGDNVSKFQACLVLSFGFLDP
jgi:hypothetical protein